MKPWRKRHAGRAFTSDAPVSFKKQRTGFVGGGSVEMAAKTREIMKYANPQLSAVLDAVAPAASTGSPIPTAPPLSATGTGSPIPTAPPLSATGAGPSIPAAPPLPATGAGPSIPAAPPLPADTGAKAGTKAAAGASTLDSIDSEQKLWELASKMSGRPIEELKKEKATNAMHAKYEELRQKRDDGVITKEEYSRQFKEAYKEWRKETIKAASDPTEALMQSIKAGKKLKKVDQKTQKAAPTDPQDAINQAIKAGGKLKKVDTAAHAAAKKAAEEKEKAEKPTMLDQLKKGATLKKADLKTQEAKHQVAAYQANKTPKQEEKLRAWSHKLGEAITELEALIKKEEDLHGKSDETEAIRKKKARLVARKKIIEEGLK